MSLLITLTIIENDAFITNLPAMNAELMKSPGCLDLYGECVEEGWFEGPFLMDDAPEQLLMCDRDDGEYREDFIMTYGCFGLEEMKIMARYVARGRIVFREDIEGNHPRFWVVEKNNARQGKLTVV